MSFLDLWYLDAKSKKDLSIHSGDISEDINSSISLGEQNTVVQKAHQIYASITATSYYELFQPTLQSPFYSYEIWIKLTKVVVKKEYSYFIPLLITCKKLHPALQSNFNLIKEPCI